MSDVPKNVVDKALELMPWGQVASYEHFIRSGWRDLVFEEGEVGENLYSHVRDPPPGWNAEPTDALRETRLGLWARVANKGYLVYMEMVPIRLNKTAKGSEIVWGGAVLLTDDDMPVYAGSGSSQNELVFTVKDKHWLLLPPHEGKVSIEIGGVEKDVTDMSLAREYMATSLFVKPVHWSLEYSGYPRRKKSEIRFQYVWASCK